jgi:hypothetical protein
VVTNFPSRPELWYNERILTPQRANNDPPTIRGTPIEREIIEFILKLPQSAIPKTKLPSKLAMVNIQVYQYCQDCLSGGGQIRCSGKKIDTRNPSKRSNSRTRITIKRKSDSGLGRKAITINELFPLGYLKIVVTVPELFPFEFYLIAGFTMNCKRRVIS